MRKPQPLDKIDWVHREQLLPNDYNPNKVAPPELELLKISILEDGWTQPIVAYTDMTIVDGFHRWTVAGHKEIYALTDGLVPVVFIHAEPSQRKLATIRHNRARGTHGVLAMSSIVRSLIDSGMPADEVATRLQMEREEVTRLMFNEGIPKSELFKNSEFSPAWKPK